MAAYKLEDNIHEKLETREIKPSVESWIKLENQLEAERPKKKFVGLLILYSIFIVGSNTEYKNEIVKEKSIENNSKDEVVVSAENDSEKLKY